MKAATDHDTEKVEADSATEPDASSDAEAAPAADDPKLRGRGRFAGRWPQLLLVLSIALVVAAAAVAGWFGVAWFRAAGDDSLSYSQVRDEVNRVAQAAVVTMNSVDYRKVDEGLKDWETATTGALHDQVLSMKAKGKQAIVEAQSVTKATVLSSAVLELDERAGKAVVMVAIKVTMTNKGAEPTPKYMRIESALVRTEDGWKLEGIGLVPITQPGS